MGFLLLLAGAVVGLPTVLWVFQRRLIYLPEQRVPSLEAVPGDWREAAIVTADGVELSAWYAPPRAGLPVVIVFNGNAGNRAGRITLGNALAGRGIGVLLTDYRGYGGNPGRPKEHGLRRDARAALAWVRTHAPGHPVVYLGESLGSGVAVELAAAEPPDALVLRSPFTSLTAVGSVHYPFLPVGLMLRDDFSSIERIRNVRAPTLVIAGTGDSVVPVEQSREIYDTAPGPKRWLAVTGAPHNDSRFTGGGEIVDAIAAFLEDSIP